jgi:hypothetical protein
VTASTGGVDVGLFFDGALAVDPTIEDCTLSGGAETTCYTLTVSGYPTSYEVSEFCPTTITDETGGLWFDGEAIYDLNGEFIANLAEIYGDDTWQMYDADGNVFVTETAEEFEGAARPDVDPSLQNHCVEGTTTADVGRGGGGPGAEAVGDYSIHISGGTIVITVVGDLDEQGDGIDANGHIEMTGGVVAVSGPTDTRNSAIDYSGGTFVMTGGTFIGTNIDGRNSEGVGTGSSQASLYLTTASTISAGTVVHIETTDGESLVTFEPANGFSVIVFSSPDLVDGESYDVYLGGTVTGDSTTNLYEDSAYTAGDLAGTATASLTV